MLEGTGTAAFLSVAIPVAVLVVPVAVVSFVPVLLIVVVSFRPVGPALSSAVLPPPSAHHALLHPPLKLRRISPSRLPSGKASATYKKMEMVGHDGCLPQFNLGIETVNLG